MKRVLVLVFLITAGVSCSRHTGNHDMADDVTAAVLFSNPYCGRNSAPTLEWAADKTELETICAASPRRSVSTDPCPISEISDKIDFSSEGVLVVEMGRKPTSGYALALADTTVEILEDTALVRIRRITPEKDAVLTQALTHPCMALRLPLGSYSRVRVIDQDERLLGELSIR